MTVNFDQDLILVVGASGATASSILPHLSQKWKRLRLVCNSVASFNRLSKDYPLAEVTRVDLGDRSACRSLISGVTTVFHIGPPFHPQETEIGYNMIDAAVLESQAPESKFQHFIYSSVLQSVFRKMLNHDHKRYVEEYLQETNLNWTIIQPSHMADSMRPKILDAISSSEDELQFTADFSAKTRFTNIFLRDLGEAVARIVEQRDLHYFALYPFVSMKVPMSHEEMWAVVGRVLGKPVKLRQQSFDEALNSAKEIFPENRGGLHPQSAIVALERTLLFYARKGLIGNPGVLGMVLGRQPTGFEEWVRDIVDKEKQPLS